jgi:hypothetical protein
MLEDAVKELEKCERYYRKTVNIAAFNKRKPTPKTFSISRRNTQLRDVKIIITFES